MYTIDTGGVRPSEDEENMAERLKRTPLYEEHVQAGAKIVPFAGYEMPVQYPTGIIQEHRAVRERAGLFDVSHMGELEVRGGDALGLVQYITTNDASRVAVGQAQYTVLCNEDGGAIDDCIVYRFEDHYMIVVNASNQDRDRDHVMKHAERFGTQVTDRSDETALLALQGPRAQRVLEKLTEAQLNTIAYYHFAEGDIGDVPAIISRTGYTGEDGFELYLPAESAVRVWRLILEAGQEEGVVPVGLGARDSLRLEMGYILYGNDLDERRTPLEAGLGWVTKLDKGEFIGREALRQQKEAGVRDRLVAFVLKERGFPRHGYEIRIDGEPAGEVTSGAHAPSLEQGIGLAYVPADAARPGTAIEVMVRGKPVPAEIVRPPFYKDGSARR
ncbi:MAG TPA: glycine cleavage system aminomethyltransferase GcvT [Longimicrobiales bacterium]|nr:glycine cleavage system aminomethyltransferase GcvT [Longimicrobiales bacterium]